MVDVLDVVFAMLIGSAGTYAVVHWDERRLPPDPLARAWPPSTKLAAAVAFGPLALPVHFWRTRRTLLGTLIGVGFTLLVFAADAAASELLHLAAGG
ncbi:MAG: hypothetical protein U0235_26630 [Polyangiaceae bacterium]